MTEKNVTDYTTVSSSTMSMGANKWYVVKGNVTIDNSLIINGTAHLILCDGATLKENKYVDMHDHKVLHIYGQSNDAGRLRVEDGPITCTLDCKLFIHGGDIYANADNHVTKAGIGGVHNNFQSRFELYVYGGKVEAHGGTAGIGGGYGNNGGTVTIYGGSVWAYGRLRSAGIGGGHTTEQDEWNDNERGSGGTLTVWGGYVYAQGGKYAAGIGGGYNRYNGTLRTANGGTVVVHGGEVIAKGGAYGAGIGGG